MQITINQIEIERAITQYILERITSRPGQEISVEMAATRGATGITANINIIDQGKMPMVAQQPETQLGMAQQLLATVQTPAAPALAPTVAGAVGNSPPFAGLTVVRSKPIEEVAAAAMAQIKAAEPAPVAAVEDAADSDDAKVDAALANMGITQSQATAAVEAEVAEVAEPEVEVQPKPAKRSLFKGMARPGAD